MNAEGKLMAVCKTRLIVENERGKNMQFNYKPTCRPFGFIKGVDEDV
jgi:hypothetical protein